MGMQRRAALFLAALAVVTSACGGDGDDSKKVSTKQTTTTQAIDDATTTTANSTPSTNPSTTVKGSARPKTTPTTQAVVAAAPTDPNAPPKPAQTGTYDYAQSGSTSQGGGVPPKGTLVVTDDGSGGQKFHRAVDSKNSADLYYVFRGDGPFITRVVLTSSPAMFNCTFGSAVPAPPWPPTNGRTFSGHATCGNSFTADFSGSITGHRTDDVGGKIVDVIVISSTLHIVGSGIDITVKDTQYWAPSLRVPTYSHEVINGTAFNQPVSGEVTSNLTSATPR